MIETVEFVLNREPVGLRVDGERKLLWVLRTELGLTGAKYGCGEGLCGACTVLVNQKAVRACQVSVKDVKKKEVMTIEGLAVNGTLHPLQKAFVEQNAFQCGYCTPGMILNAYSLLVENPKPSETEIVRAMEDNLCRCGAHVRVIQAVQSAAKATRGGKRR